MKPPLVVIDSKYPFNMDWHNPHPTLWQRFSGHVGWRIEMAWFDWILPTLQYGAILCFVAMLIGLAVTCPHFVLAFVIVCLIVIL